MREREYREKMRAEQNLARTAAEHERGGGALKGTAAEQGAPKRLQASGRRDQGGLRRDRDRKSGRLLLKESFFFFLIAPYREEVTSTPGDAPLHQRMVAGGGSTVDW